MAIGIGGSLVMLVLYGVGGIAFGLFVLTRQRWVLWRQPAIWGAVVALAQTGASINDWPLAWMQYDTALSTRSFVARQIAFVVIELVANATMFSLSFMAAESLGRRAFPKHPQFWRLWGRDAGRSREVMGRTLAGYLLVPVFIAYEVALYFFATRTLGWWTPSEALFNPDVLAAYAPWFSAIAKSFQAGFWEESLFRAVPIAGAALIGDRLGNRRLWIVIAFVVQAAIRPSRRTRVRWSSSSRRSRSACCTSRSACCPASCCTSPSMRSGSRCRCSPRLLRASGCSRSSLSSRSSSRCGS
jgi:hypothetical protein